MNNPFITGVLQANISLFPYQLDNNIDVHIKKNLIKKYEKRCFKEHGFIHKIYDITRKSVGYIIPENPTGSVTYLVSFSCRICNPIVNKIIITKILRLNNSLIKSECGAIEVINDVTKLDQNKFLVLHNGEVYFKKDDITKIKLESGTYLKMLITSKTFNDGDTRIVALGNILDIANNDEIQEFYNYEYK